MGHVYTITLHFFCNLIGQYPSVWGTSQLNSSWPGLWDINVSASPRRLYPINQATRSLTTTYIYIYRQNVNSLYAISSLNFGPISIIFYVQVDIKILQVMGIFLSTSDARIAFNERKTEKQCPNDVILGIAQIYTPVVHGV